MVDPGGGKRGTGREAIVWEVMRLRQARQVAHIGNLHAQKDGRAKAANGIEMLARQSNSCGRQPCYGE